MIDARGMRCPWPALRAARALREHGIADILTDDPIAPAELAALAVAHNARLEAFPDAPHRFRLTSI
ncbi:MAG: sulfurtransferase TusA family protein [Pseudomonadota bacterium]